MTGWLKFRPRLVPTLVTIPAVLVMLGLGTWQMERLAWKNSLIAERAGRLAMAEVVLPARIDNPDQWTMRPVRVRGEFLHDRELYVAAHSLRGNAGYQVLTPLKREDRSIVLINRGWIPFDRRQPETRAEGQVAGTVEISGTVRPADKPGWAMPDNRPAENFWFYVDVPAMGRALGFEAVVPVVVDAGPAANPGGFPIGGQARTEIRNEHLQYAVTWYALAATLIVIYVIYHRRGGGA
ncbi:MAG: SURF1 family protein [Alphaproteobacteria bacterium]